MPIVVNIASVSGTTPQGEARRSGAPPAVGEPRTDARALHAKLGSKQEFTNWFKKRKEECDLVEDEDFGVSDKFVKNPQGGRPTVDYWLTLDAAKEMAMLERNEQGKRIRRYLIEVEKRFRAH